MSRCKACPYGVESVQCEDCEHHADPVCLTTLVLDAVRAYVTARTPEHKQTLRYALARFNGKTSASAGAVLDWQI